MKEKVMKLKETKSYTGKTIPKRTMKFTMIELLVVISIIMLLVGILMPALSSSQEKGRQATCMSNLKQLAQANTQYSADYGVFCLARFESGGMGGYPDFWYGYKESSSAEVDYSQGFLSKYIGDKESIIHCPSWKTDDSSARGYGYNAYGVGSISYLSGYDSSGYTHYRNGMQPSKFKSASTTIMFGDCAKYSGGKLVEDGNIFPTFSLKGASVEKLKTRKPTTTYCDSRMHARHNGFVTVAWVDGHVSSEELSFSVERNATEGNYSENYKVNKIGHIGPEDNSYWDPWEDTIPES